MDQYSTPVRSLSGQTTRVRIVIHGAVQGVGFRPTVYRLAARYGLRGWVSNSAQGVIIEAEGPAALLGEFTHAVSSEKPPLASIHSSETTWLDAVGYSEFNIRESSSEGDRSAVVMPDIATCDDCLDELFTPSDRRFRYPFINCTNCGPRFTIIDALPYDRPNTSMRGFRQCPSCLAEYRDPSNRRFHAQPNACPVCGPSVELRDSGGSVLAHREDALRDLVRAIRDGGIAAVKGLGGFHLVCDATRPDAVRELRRRKHREEKPFALMVPTLDHARRLASLTPEEERLLTSPASPIVLVRRKAGFRDLDEAVARENPYLGIMLPYTPLHHILMRDLAIPIVATSGNLSDEPICTDEQDAFRRLHGIADLFLTHDRPIRRHADDSVVRIVEGREQVLRRARGYAPLPIMTSHELPAVLAVGAHLKNTIAVSSGRRIIVSQHIGDLETAESIDVYRRVISDVPRLHGVTPLRIAADLHPDYVSSQYASQQGIPVAAVQHHAGHVYACMAENELEPPLLGVSWDGTGLGTDGTIWGGEFIRIDEHGWTRVAHLRQFSLPGGDAAIKEPRRSGLALLYELSAGDPDRFADLPPMEAFAGSERRTILRMLGRSVNSPRTSSAGRLFDAVASILGVRQTVRHEGQAAMNLEWLADGTNDSRAYSMRVEQAGNMLQLDWGPMLLQIIEDTRAGIPAASIARGLHDALADGICTVARSVGLERIVLTGGCFQNLLLTHLAMRKLREKGFSVYIHQRIPPNDGGIAAGQAFAAALQSVHEHLVPDAEEAR